MSSNETRGGGAPSAPAAAPPPPPSYAFAHGGAPSLSPHAHAAPYTAQPWNPYFHAQPPYYCYPPPPHSSGYCYPPPPPPPPDPSSSPSPSYASSPSSGGGGEAVKPYQRKRKSLASVAPPAAPSSSSSTLLGATTSIQPAAALMEAAPPRQIPSQKLVQTPTAPTTTQREKEDAREEERRPNKQQRVEVQTTLFGRRHWVVHEERKEDALQKHSSVVQNIREKLSGSKPTKKQAQLLQRDPKLLAQVEMPRFIASRHSRGLSQEEIQRSQEEHARKLLGVKYREAEKAAATRGSRHR
ncbi:Vegetative cell wall protein gp1-like [Balamuthia mandrillaris]